MTLEEMQDRWEDDTLGLEFTSGKRYMLRHPVYPHRLATWEYCGYSGSDKGSEFAKFWTNQRVLLEDCNEAFCFFSKSRDRFLFFWR